MLQDKGYKVWYDEYTLTLGDNLRRSIEQGLAQSRYAVVVLSPSFFAKKWTNLELDGLFALEKPGEKRILPVWHNVSATDVERFSSFMAMRLGVPTSKGLDQVVEMIDEAVQRENGSTAKLQPPSPSSSPSLHPHSIELLMAAKESNGSITAVWHMGGFSVTAGGQSFGPDGDPRTVAVNIHCLQELVVKGLAEQPSESAFVLTQEGFDYVVPAGVAQAPQPQLPNLTQANLPLAKDIMQAAVAGNGRVYSSASMHGHSLQAGGRGWESGGDRRIVARWKSVLRELVDTGLLMPRSEQVYLVSHLGYLWTDSMNVQSQISERTLQRFRFLKYLYEKAGGGEFVTVPHEDVAQNVGLSEDDYTNAFRYLAQEGLVRGSDKGVCLTHAGVVEIETALSHSETPTEHFPVNIIQIGQMSNSQIQQGTVGSTQSGSFASLDLAAVAEFVAGLKTVLPQLGLTGNNEAVARSDIVTIETQLSSPQPKVEIIKESLRSMRSIAEGAAGSMAASGIITGIAKLLG